MKNLDNLIEDIYSKLSVLGEGKPLDASAEDIDALGESIKEVLHHWANPSPRSSDMLRMSNIGKPTRQLWYDLKSENESTESLPAPVFIKFLYVHLLEEVLLFLVIINLIFLSYIITDYLYICCFLVEIYEFYYFYLNEF